MRRCRAVLTVSGGGGGLSKAPGSRVWAKRQRGFQGVRGGGSPPDRIVWMGNSFSRFMSPPGTGGVGGGSHK